MTYTAGGMNYAAVDWAWAQPIANPGARVVLLCLARLGGDAWACTPSQEELAEEALVSISSVCRHLAHLEAEGYISREHRYSEDKKRDSDRIKVNPGADLHVNLETSSELQEHLHVNLTSRDLHVNLRTSSDLPTRQIDVYGQEDLHVNLETSSDLTTRQSDRIRARLPLCSSPSENYEREDLSSRPRKPKAATPAEDTPPRQDVEQLCQRLFDWLIKKDYRNRPEKISKGWRDEARLLLDKGNAPLDEAFQVLDWCQRDTFWWDKINSMPTFRKQYGQLEMKSRDARGAAGVPAKPPASPAAALPPRDGYTTNKSKIFGTRSRS